MCAHGFVHVLAQKYTVYRWKYEERKQVGVFFSLFPMYVQGTKLRSSGSMANSFAHWAVPEGSLDFCI